MVWIILQGWFAVTILWLALSILYQYRRPIRNLFKRAFLWIGVRKIGQLLEDVGAGLIASAMVIWLISINLPEGSPLDLKDHVALTWGGITGFVLWFTGTRLNPEDGQS